MKRTELESLTKVTKVTKMTRRRWKQLLGLLIEAPILLLLHVCSSMSLTRMTMVVVEEIINHGHKVDGDD